MSMQPYGPAVLRLVVGAVFVAHGARKVFTLWGGAGLTRTAAYVGQIGFTPAHPLAFLAALAEFIGGLLLTAGALIRLMLRGPGVFSIDGRRARFAESEAYGRARLRAGKV
jgi:uncharacterized membrane protein YphA (DoxX/SURF4 family)